MKKTLLVIGGLLFSCVFYAQVGINTTSPHPSAALEVYATNKGFLPPRLTTAQRDAIDPKPAGLMIYNTDLSCMQYWNATTWIGDCSLAGAVTTLDCAAVVSSGTLYSGQPASGVTSTVPYTGGNGGAYSSGSFPSTGVTGLTANLSGGVLNTGNGNLVFNIAGTPSSAGTASFAISVGGQNCSFTVPVMATTAMVESLICGSAVFTPDTLIQGMAYTGNLSVPYTGGNGASYSQISFTNGLTFTLPAGSLNNGNGNLIYNVSGTPQVSGSISIPIIFGGQSCNVSATVGTANTVIIAGNPQPWKRHNLGADTSLDPDTPVFGIHGNYYQWGRAAAVADANTAPASIPGYNTTPALDGSWQDGVKTGNDPCPSGFRVPTRQQWQNLISNNISSNIGTFTADFSNFGSAKVFTSANGNKLTFPAAGNRDSTSGFLFGRGSNGNYWTSTQDVAKAYAAFLNAGAGGGLGSNVDRPNGFSVRCISE